MCSSDRHRLPRGVDASGVDASGVDATGNGASCRGAAWSRTAGVAGCILTAMLLIMTPVGLTIMLDPELPRQRLWTTTLYLALLAALTWVATLRRTDARRATALFAAVFVLAVILEGIGAYSGWPFGAYAYSDVLGPLLFGIVPPAIGFAWYLVTVNAWLFLHGLAPAGARNAILLPAAALLVTGMDVLLEPFASFVNGFWTWSGGSVPVQNYAAWFAAGLGFLLLVKRALDLPSREGRGRVPRIPALVLGATVLNCVVVNVARGHMAEIAAGLLLIAAPLAVAAFASAPRGRRNMETRI